MAKAYEIICPECGQRFLIATGALLNRRPSEDQIVKVRNADEPDFCPNCNHRISVNDPDFHDHVVSTMMID